MKYHIFGDFLHDLRLRPKQDWVDGKIEVADCKQFIHCFLPKTRMQCFALLFSTNWSHFPKKNVSKKLSRKKSISSDEKYMSFIRKIWPFTISPEVRMWGWYGKRPYFPYKRHIFLILRRCFAQAPVGERDWRGGTIRLCRKCKIYFHTFLRADKAPTYIFTIIRQSTKEKTLLSHLMGFKRCR